MKIIDNKKDYYDYLAGIYGIDELVVFDRRGSAVLNTEYSSLKGMIITSVKKYYLPNLFRISTIGI